MLEKMRLSGELHDSASVEDRKNSIFNKLKEALKIPTVLQKIVEEYYQTARIFSRVCNARLTTQEFQLIYGPESYKSSDLLTVTKFIFFPTENIYEIIINRFFREEYNLPFPNNETETLDQMFFILKPILQNPSDIYYDQCLNLLEITLTVYTEIDQSEKYLALLKDVILKLHEYHSGEKKSYWKKRLSEVIAQYNNFLTGSPQKNSFSLTDEEISLSKAYEESQSHQAEIEEKRRYLASIRKMRDAFAQEKSEEESPATHQEEPIREDKHLHSIQFSSAKIKNIFDQANDDLKLIIQNIFSDLTKGLKSSRERGKMIHRSYKYQGKEYPIFHCSLIGADRLFYTRIEDNIVILQIGEHDYQG